MVLRNDKWPCQPPAEEQGTLAGLMAAWEWGSRLSPLRDRVAARRQSAKQPPVQCQIAAHPIECHNGYPVHGVFMHTDQVRLAKRLKHPVGQIHRHNLQHMPASSWYDRRGARST